MDRNAYIEENKQKEDKMITETLIQKYNLNPNYDDALIKASENGDLEAVDAFLKAGADVHAWDDRALHWTSGNGHLEVVKVLLEAGANVHADDDCALQWASKNGHLEVVKVLKEYHK